jgi:NADH-quinone oxidoreductase E subunit
MPLTDETRAAAREIMSRYPRPRSALLPMLHLVQSEEGYVTPEGVRFCAEELGLTKAEVGAVATFYTMYKRRPTGEFLVSVCTNTLCDVLGGQEIYDTLSEQLGVGHDQTTADGRITLEHAECLAACDYAPVVTVNYEFFDQQTPYSATELVEQLRAGRRPLPTRGAPLCTFKEISRQLAGFIDERPGAVDAPSAGEPTLVGTRLAVQRGETAPAYDAPIPLDKPAEPAPAATAGAGAPPAAPAPAEGERPAAATTAEGERPAAATTADGERPAEGEPAAAPAPAEGERPAAATTADGERPAAATTAAEQSAAAGTARYGGPPGEASSGGGEGGAGVRTAASDPAADQSPDKEPQEAQAASADPDAPTAPGPQVGTGTGAATSAGTGASGSGDPGTGQDRPTPTNRGRKTRRKES